jgi:hypothetical protein
MRSALKASLPVEPQRQLGRRLELAQDNASLLVPVAARAVNLFQSLQRPESAGKEDCREVWRG